jgi:DNA-binding transcriptional ArsR family regulator
MTLTGMKKHVGVLEQAGLVTTEKVGRVRTCRLGPRRLEEETAWIERYRQLWDARFDELDKVVDRTETKGQGRWTRRDRLSPPSSRTSDGRTDVRARARRHATINGPARIVFEAWTKPELFKQWWVPKSMRMSLLSCEIGCSRRGQVQAGVRV